MATGKCPKCEKTMPYIAFDTPQIKKGASAYKGVTYQCPYCHTVLAVAIDPIAIKGDIVSAIKRLLGR